MDEKWIVIKQYTEDMASHSWLYWPKTHCGICMTKSFQYTKQNEMNGELCNVQWPLRSITYYFQKGKNNCTLMHWTRDHRVSRIIIKKITYLHFIVQGEGSFNIMYIIVYPLFRVWSLLVYSYKRVTSYIVKGVLPVVGRHYYTSYCFFIFICLHTLIPPLTCWVTLQPN